MRTFTEEEVEEMLYCDKCGYIEPQCECKHPKTNYDRIKVMSVEEMANFLVDVETHGYYDQSVSGNFEMIEWLQAEAEE